MEAVNAILNPWAVNMAHNTVYLMALLLPQGMIGLTSIILGLWGIRQFRAILRV